jgi:hypothetical protein
MYVHVWLVLDNLKDIYTKFPCLDVTPQVHKFCLLKQYDTTHKVNSQQKHHMDYDREYNETLPVTILYLEELTECCNTFPTEGNHYLYKNYSRFNMFK